MRSDGVLEAGEVLLGKYRIEELLGRGGMGLVYRAWHLQLNERVALKVLRQDVQLDDEAVMRFQREAQAAVKLKSEHVARIQDVGVFDNGSPYICMEFLAGADLGTLVDKNGAMEVATAVDLILQACDGLAEAHAIGIVHRDIKPNNLFVSTRPDGSHVVKILDFGISKSAIGLDLSLTQTASVLGTPAYMSPEQMRSARKVDARTDVWSLGIVLYELVEARRPFRAETFSEMCVMAAADPHDPLSLAPELDLVIARCLAKAPDGRYQSVADLAAAIAPFARDPRRAKYYVERTRRVLARAQRSATPRPVVDPAVALVAQARARGLRLPTNTNIQRSRVGLWIGLAVVVGAAVTAFIIVRSRMGPSKPIEGETIKILATPAGDAGASAAAESSVVVAGASSPRVFDGSAGSASVGSAAVGSALTTKRGTGKKSGSKRATTDSATTGSATTSATTGALGSARGSDAKPDESAGSGSAKKCNVWETRTGGC